MSFKIFSILFFYLTQAQSQTIENNILRIKIMDPKKETKVKGPVESFTGKVKVAMLLQNEEPSQMSAGYVSFEAGARSAWHTHPRGQLLVITEGFGLVQEFGQPIRTLKKGDVVWTPAGVKHWHGASRNLPMRHLAIQESLDGKSVEWMQKVTDEEYNQRH